MRTEFFESQNPNPDRNSCTVAVIVRRGGIESRETVSLAHQAMARTSHRVGFAVDGKTSDGVGFEYVAGTGLQRYFLDKYINSDGRAQGAPRLAVGNLWLPQDAERRRKIKDIIEAELIAAGYKNYVWRESQEELLDTKFLGDIGRQRLPHFAQLIVPVKDGMNAFEIEKDLILVREKALQSIDQKNLSLKDPQGVHFMSFSAARIIYVSRSDPRDRNQLFKDTQSSDFVSSAVKLHGRFSTKGQTELKNIQPLPNGIAHNGTGVTITGIRAAMPAHQPRLLREAGAAYASYFPVMRPGNSDSADLDRLKGIEEIGGTSLAEFKMKYLPKAAGDGKMDPQQIKNAKRTLSALTEAFDGPAFVIMTAIDAGSILVTLDANGLRPAMMVETSEYVTFGSEAGMWGFDVEKIINVDELDRGEMRLIDVPTGVVHTENALEQAVAEKSAFQAAAALVRDIPSPSNASKKSELDRSELMLKLKLAGYSDEDLSKMLAPMVKDKAEPKGSMGRQNRRPARGPNFRPWSHYYTEINEQIVAPPHNSELDRDVMDLTTFSAKPFDEDGNPRAVWRFEDRFTLTEALYESFLDAEGRNRFEIVDCSFDVAAPEGEYRSALDKIASKVLKAGIAGRHVVLTDEFLDKDKAAIMMDHAVGIANSTLNREGIRGKICIVVRDSYTHTGHEAFILKSAGADLVVPYFAEAIVRHQAGKKNDAKDYVALTPEQSVGNFHEALTKSILISMQRTGTIRGTSVRGAQQFEAYGISKDVIRAVHPGLSCQGGGHSFEEIERRIRVHHRKIFYSTAMDFVTDMRRQPDGSISLNPGGRFSKNDPDKEPHAQDQKSIALLHEAVQNPDPRIGYRAWKAYTAYVHSMGQERGVYPRDDWRFKGNKKPVPLDEVEPLEKLAKRFVSQAMSVGAIHEGAHRDIHYAINSLPIDPVTKEGAESNTGEGGYDEALLGTNYQPAVVQWSTAAFGIRPQLIRTAKIVEIKFGQGAKTGVGGLVDGKKVNQVVAERRFVEPGTDLNSPPQHMDMLSIEDLKQKIKYILSVNPEAEIRIKIVAKDGCDGDAVGAAKAMRNAIEELKSSIAGIKGKMSIVLAGNSGGTGNARKNDIQYSGAEWETYLPLVRKALHEDGHGDIKLIVDGGLRSGYDMAFAAVAGADKSGFGTLIMYAIGCLDQGQCETNECMTGVATTSESLIAKSYKGQSEYVKRIVMFILQELREVMGANGFRTYDEMIGADCLENVAPYEINALENTDIMRQSLALRQPQRCVKTAEKIRENLESPSIDSQIRMRCPEVTSGASFHGVFTNVDNTQIATGSNIAGDLSVHILGITRDLKQRVLPDDHIVITLLGTPGYATAGMLTQGITVNIEGIVGDSLGVNNRGGIVIVKPPKGALSEKGKRLLLAGNLANGFTTGGFACVSGIAGHSASFRQSGGIHVYKGTRAKAGQFKTGGTFIAWKYGVGPNSFAKHTGGESFIRAEGKNFVSITAQFNESVQRNNMIVPLADPSAKVFLKKCLTEAYERTQDLELHDLLAHFEECAGEFVHIKPKKNAAGLQSSLGDTLHKPGLMSL